MHTYKRTREEEAAERNREWLTPSLAGPGQLSSGYSESEFKHVMQRHRRKSVPDEIMSREELDSYVRKGSEDDVKMNELKWKVINSLPLNKKHNTFERLKEVAKKLKEPEERISIGFRQLEAVGIMEMHGGFWRLTDPVREFLSKQEAPGKKLHLF